MITTVMIATTLCGAPQTTAKPAEPASASQDARVPAAVQLEVDVSRFEDEPQVREWHVGWIREDGTKALTSQGVAVVTKPDAPKVIVTLVWAKADVMEYGVTVSTQQPGAEPKELESFPCLCNSTELTEEVAERMPAALAQLSEPSSSEEPDPVAADTDPAGDTGATDDSNGEVDHDRTPRGGAAIGPLGYVGIAATAGGLGLVGWGAATLAKGAVLVDSGREQLIRQDDYRPRGRVLLGAGIGAAAVGLTMLVVDITVMKRRRDRTTAVAPHASSTSFGLTLTGRF